MNIPPAYVVIGHPIGHTMSPFVHRRLFAIQNRPFTYDARDIEPDALSVELPRLLQTLRGVNVTIPYKQAIIPLLDGLRGRAELYQSVNTVSVTPNGILGYNTDADGFLLALQHQNIPLKGRIALLGCGGAGRTFACEAALAGCSIVNAVRPSSRAAAENLRQFVLALSPDTCYEVTDMDTLSGDFDLLINATPVGMYPRIDTAPVDQSVLAHTAAVFDAVYNPQNTRLLEMAKSNGARVLGGMPMLVWQATAAQGIWFGTSFAANDIAQLIVDAQEEMERHFH